MQLPGIVYTGDVSKFVFTENDNNAAISMYKDLDYFADYNAYNEYVKEIEKLVRTSREYSLFISWVKGTLGVNFCQIVSTIYDTDATIEMHHHPLTLYDISSIMLNWFMKRGYQISTFRVAKKVLDEHYAVRVPVVMTAKTMHEAIHNKDIHVNLSQLIGNFNAFLNMYSEYLDDELKYKIASYIDTCKTTPSFDRGILDISKVEKMLYRG